METEAALEDVLASRTRRCSRCRKTTPLADFVKQPREKFGRGYHCKRCAADRVRAFQRRKREEAS
jgi:hypothetical protein